MSSEKPGSLGSDATSRSSFRGGRQALRQMLPRGWRFAHQCSVDLVGRTRHLAWMDRSRVLDNFYTRHAEGMLGATRVASMVNGQVMITAGLQPQPPPDEGNPSFVLWCRAIATALLIELDENVEVRHPHQALCYLLALEPRFARAAAAWIGVHGMAPIARAMAVLPGHSLVLLAASPNDTVERFLARDAFWQAIEQSD